MDNYRQKCLLLTEKNATSSTIDGRAVDSINNNVYLVDSRKYIEEIGLECGTDNKKTMGTCKENLASTTNSSAKTTKTINLKNIVAISSSEDQNQTNSSKKNYRDPSDMHRCVGPRGGHTDLIAWDVTETLYSIKSKQNIS